LEKERGNGEKDGVRSAGLAKRIFYEIDFYYPETLYYPFCTETPLPNPSVTCIPREQKIIQCVQA